MARPPRTFEGFIGQRRVVATLERLIRDAIARGERLPHLAFYAESGLGKTRLAEASAIAMSNANTDEEPTNFHIIQAGPGCIRQLRDILCKARYADIIFLDEAHALDRITQELVYIAIDKDQTFALDERGNFDRTKFEPIAPVSFIIATNRPGELAKALRTRIALAFELERYLPDELKAIAQRIGASRGRDLTPQSARVVGEHAGTPRTVEHIIEMVARRYPAGPIAQDQVETVLREDLGYDENQTTASHRRILTALASAPHGRMSATDLVTILGLDARYVREIEGPLVRRGMVTRGNDHSRAITGLGRAVVRATAASDPEAPTTERNRT